MARKLFSVSLIVLLSAACAFGAASDYKVDTSGNVHGYTLKLRDASRGYWLQFLPGSSFSADRILTFTTGDANRTITLSGDPTLGDWFDQSVKTTADVTLNSLVISALASLTTPAESWIGPSSTTGLYFKSGKVGIGTTTPAVRFETTYSGSPSTRFVNSQTPGAGSGAGLTLITGTPTAADQRLGWIGFGGITAGTTYNYPARVSAFSAEAWDSTSAGAYLSFSTTPIGSATRAERARITDSGNFGIGVSSPGSLLDIGNSTAGAEIRLREDSDNGTGYIGFKAPDAITTAVTYTWPEDGTAGYVLTTDGSGTLSWSSASGSGMADPMTAAGDLIYRNTSNTTDKLPVGTAGQILTAIDVGGTLVPQWAAAPAGLTIGGDDSPAGQIQYRSSGNFAANDYFYLDPTNLDLYLIGSKAGTKLLQLTNTSTGSSSISGIQIGNSSGADTFSILVNSHQFTDALDYAYITQKLNAPLIFKTSNTERVRILGTGNTGFNTATPDRKVDILDSTNPQLRLTQSDATNYSDFKTDSNGYLTISTSGGSTFLDDDYVFIGSRLYLYSGSSSAVTSTGPLILMSNNDGPGSMTVSGTSISVDKKFGILEGGATPSKYTYFQGGDQADDITYTLPTAYPGVNGYCLKSTIAGVWSWGDCTTGSGHTFLSATHTDTTAAAVQRGDLITGQGASAKWARLAKGSQDQVLMMGANEPNWKSQWINASNYTDLATAIGAAVSAGGGTVYVPVGTYNVSSTINITSNGVRILGESSNASIIKWAGNDYSSSGTLASSTIINIANGTNPLYGVGIENIKFDGDNKAGCFIAVNNVFYSNFTNINGVNWTGRSGYPGWALVLTSSGSYVSGFQNWINVHFYSPHHHVGTPTYAYGVSIGVSGTYTGATTDLNEISFMHSGVQYSNEAGAIGLKLGTVDHSFFSHCFFAHSYDGEVDQGTIGISVAPQKAAAPYPGNITFIATPVDGGIQYDTSAGTLQAETNTCGGGSDPCPTATPVLLFYPYYTADGQKAPPLSYDGVNYLPWHMVRGAFDHGGTIGVPLEEEDSIASNTTITLKKARSFITGNTTITTIQFSPTITPWIAAQSEITLIPVSTYTMLNTGGNIQESYTSTAYRAVKLIWSSSYSKWMRVE